MSASIRSGLKVVCFRKLLIPLQQVPSRCYKKGLSKDLRIQYKSRLTVGPEPDRHRSEFINWNYDSEVYSFGKRLGEDLNDDILKKVFLHRSYIEREKKKIQELGIAVGTSGLDVDHNEQLAKSGEQLASNYVLIYLRNAFPNYFEEGIRSIHEYLMSEDVLCNIGRHLGIPELIMCDDFPLRESTIVTTLMAFIGALEQEKGKERAHLFVRDFILPQLIGKDINEMWNVVNPMGLLTAVLHFQKRGLPEPRLLWEGASSTLMSVYHIGIYSDQKLIGKAPGETAQIAEEMAARDALKRLCQTQESRPALLLGKLSENLKLDEKKVNISAKDIIEQFSPKESTASTSSKSIFGIFKGNHSLNKV
ncbi:hypothetical protein LOTGIDRAFT_239065 [Lottia gigantea]|uniref:Large ribosomal subunit protein mL44 n=1 Tax=Lottia gigantea TaxID=225164 RepID=V4AM02_LOTGI|nr:hypothetical protein LOTGIDRAFT_239065 [Lottia gigantea]ESO98157.1 hypothetical protein LOTGIDRAFT_239065 [Lottia gigantea]